MEAESASLVVAAELEAAELLDGRIVSVHVQLLDLAAELADSVGGGVDVVDGEEHVGRRSLVTAVHPAGDVTTALLCLDAVAEIVDGDGTRELPLSEVVRADVRAWERRCLVLAVRFRKCRGSAFEKLPSRAGFGRSVVAAAVIA